MRARTAAALADPDRKRKNSRAAFEESEAMTRHYKKRRSWTAGEVRDLERLCRRRARGDAGAPSVLKFARANKRTEGATRQKIHQLGLSMTG